MNILFNWKNLFILAVFLIIIGFSLSIEESINVEIKGEVVHPGVYKVYDNLTTNDIIALAGGLTKKADISNINLSKKVYDEMVIIVSNKEEISDFTKIKYIENECFCPKVVNDSCVTLEVPDDEIIKNTKISLNKASKEELMQLPGIGESKALAIIEYRKTNKFVIIEDIMKVKGIGKSIYEKIKDLITI